MTQHKYPAEASPSVTNGLNHAEIRCFSAFPKFGTPFDKRCCGIQLHHQEIPHYCGGGDHVFQLQKEGADNGTE